MRHDEVHDDDVGARLDGEFHGLFSVLRLGDDFHVLLRGEECGKTEAHHCVVVCDE